MALFKPIKTTDTSLTSLAIKEGQLILTTDTNKLYFDIDASHRVLINNVDNAMSTTSENPVENKIVKSYIDNSVGYCLSWNLEGGDPESNILEEVDAINGEVI